MVSERLKALFIKVKNEQDKRRREIKPEDVAKFVAKELASAFPVIGPIIKDAIDELSEDEKEELIREFKV